MSACGRLLSFAGADTALREATARRVRIAPGRPAPGRVVELEFGDVLRPAWLEPGRRVGVWLESMVGADLPGRPLAHLVEAGARHTAVAESGGQVAFGYDPDVVIDAIRNERYFTPHRPWHTRLRVPYQRVPGEWRLRAFRWLARRPRPSAQPVFPDWPVDPSVEALRASFVRGVEHATGARLESSHWPGGRSWAVAVSHDVDTAAGLDLAADVARFEAAAGLRATWFVVGELFGRGGATLEQLRRLGHEIGLHGDRHDNRLAYEDATGMETRLAASAGATRGWDVCGFRAPSLLESPALRERLRGRFAYTSDVPDTEVGSLVAPRRGCGTVFPFDKQGLLEIPITLPMDDKLVLAGLDEDGIVDVWRRKLDWVRQVGGLAQLVVHNEPHLLRRCRGAFERVAGEIAADRTAWHATLGEVAEWWRESNGDG